MGDGRYNRGGYREANAPKLVVGVSKEEVELARNAKSSANIMEEKGPPIEVDTDAGGPESKGGDGVPVISTPAAAPIGGEVELRKLEADIEVDSTLTPQKTPEFVPGDSEMQDMLGEEGASEEGIDPEGEVPAGPNLDGEPGVEGEDGVPDVPQASEDEKALDSEEDGIQIDEPSKF